MDVTIRTTVIAGSLLVAVLAAGCGTQPATASASTVEGCADYGVYAIDHHITVTRMPAACRGLSKAQVNAAAANAIDRALGGRSKKPAWRRLTAEAAPRVAYLFTAPQPAPSASPQAYRPAGGTPLREGSGSDLALGLAALGAWLVTACSGAWLLGSWIISRGIRRPRRPRRPAARAASGTGAPPGVLLAHFGLATAGLLVWVSYLLADWAPLAWIAVGLLILITGLGLSVVTLGLPGRRSDVANVPASASPAARPVRGRVPVALIAGHGLFAAATVLLVLLAAIGTPAG